MGQMHFIIFKNEKLHGKIKFLIKKFFFYINFKNGSPNFMLFQLFHHYLNFFSQKSLLPRPKNRLVFKIVVLNPYRKVRRHAVTTALFHFTVALFKKNNKIKHF